MQVFPGADDTGVESGEVQSPGETGMLDLEAAVHHHSQAAGRRHPSGWLGDETELEPEDLAGALDGLVRELLPPEGPGAGATFDVSAPAPGNC